MTQNILFLKRRAFVNKEIAIKLRGRKTNRKELSKIFKKAWALAKKKIKS